MKEFSKYVGLDVHKETIAVSVAEIGDLRRFASAPQLMAYLGVVPSEHSSGGTKSRGGITKTGNGHVRRVLVEARGKLKVQACTAIARELAGFIWAIGQALP